MFTNFLHLSFPPSLGSVSFFFWSISCNSFFQWRIVSSKFFFSLKIFALNLDTLGEQSSRLKGCFFLSVLWKYSISSWSPWLLLRNHSNYSFGSNLPFFFFWFFWEFSLISCILHFFGVCLDVGLLVLFKNYAYWSEDWYLSLILENSHVFCLQILPFPHFLLFLPSFICHWT